LGDSKTLVAKSFFSSENANSYESLVKLATFGRDSVWKRNLAKRLTLDNYCILDLACGTGILSSYISQPTERIIIGSDLTRDYLLRARHRGAYVLLTNSIAESLPYRSRIFDAVISSYLAKYVDLGQVVKEHWRILNSGGMVVFHDFTLPEGNFIKDFWKLYFKILHLSGVFIRNWKDAFSGLDKVIIESNWVERLISELNKTGFRSIFCKYYTWGTSAIVSAIKP